MSRPLPLTHLHHSMVKAFLDQNWEGVLALDLLREASPYSVLAQRHEANITEMLRQARERLQEAADEARARAFVMTFTGGVV